MLNVIDNSLLPPGRHTFQGALHRGNRKSNISNANSQRYLLCGDRDSLEKAYDSEIYRNSWNYRSLETLRASILAKDSECRQRDESQFIGALKDAQVNSETHIETKIGNCLCKSPWCPKCRKLYYVPKYHEQVQKFDYAKTRHVMLTVYRDIFKGGLHALRTITDKKLLSAFIRKLRNGKKVKVGDRWEWLHLPINIKQALAVLEFHRDGYPHWHFLIEVENEGKSGMIGNENLLRSWKHGIVRETYFRDLNHWQSIPGYFADNGYFEKGKEYQTKLPEDIQRHYERRVRRITYYNGKKTGVHEEERIDITEEAAYAEIAKYFDRKKKGLRNQGTQDDKDNHKISYKALLNQCGTKTYIRVVINRKLLQMFLPVPFNTIKEILSPTYTKKHGYVCNLSMEALSLIEANSVRVVESRGNYDLLFEDEDERNLGGL